MLQIHHETKHFEKIKQKYCWNKKTRELSEEESRKKYNYAS